MQRRQYLAAAGAAGLAGLAGCSATGRALGSVAAPEVPRDTLDADGWVLTDETTGTVLEEQYGPVTLVAKAHTLVFENEALAATVKADTLGSVDGTLATFSATRVRFDPDLTKLPDAVGRRQVIDQLEANSRAQFVDRMRDAGLTDVEQSETGDLTIDTGETARYTGFTAVYEVGEVSFALPDGETMTLAVDPIAVAGDLAVWVHGDGVLVAGGAYPAENVATSEHRNLTDAISLTVDVDLGLTPDAYASTVETLISGTR